MGDFKQTHGDVNSGVSSERAPLDGKTAATGFDDGPKGEQMPKGPGPGIPAGGMRIR